MPIFSFSGGNTAALRVNSCELVFSVMWRVIPTSMPRNGARRVVCDAMALEHAGVHPHAVELRLLNLHVRIWATGILKEYIKKGFVLDDERMKNGGALFGSRLQTSRV